MNPMLNIATRAIILAGNIINKNYDLINTKTDLSKNNKIYIKKIQNNIEYIIIKTINRSYPKHSIYGTQNIINKDHKVQWIINPISGINNFIKKFPYFSLSIFIKINKKVIIALIYDPIRNELFSAVKGGGALLNNYKLRNNNSYINYKNILLSTNLPFSSNEYYFNMYLYLKSSLNNLNLKIRLTGSNILDIVYAASGRIDLFIKYNINKYCINIGNLIIPESGIIINDFSGNNNYLISKEIIIGHSYLVNKIIAAIKIFNNKYYAK